MDEQELEKLRSNQLRQRELQRRSLDTIRIFNPLEKDFRFTWDGYPMTIKAQASKDVERYKAELYFKKISQYIIGEMQIKQGNEMLNKRDERGLDKILDKYQESRQIWDNVPRLNNKDLLEKIAKDAILGLVEEYGKEEPLPEQKVQPKPDQTNLNEEIFKNFANKRVSAEPLPERPIVKPLKKANE